ncbi:DNA topoisomerase, partial [Thiolapillus sp.]|uniref:DNA topoisomerase n=1 Tax=Thiolapillus sp. TaxID=2017437 RepID=UPI003AF8385F
MRLFIAEKPSVAKAIAGELGATGKGDGYIQCGDDKITWCFGHMLEQAGPDEYTPDDVPVNREYAGWADAARGRGRADWLIGMNLSRAFTLRAQRGGSRALLTVGRVQTPTLALVVARDREIEAFKPVPYHTIRAEIAHAGGSFPAAWKAKEDQAGLDAEGRLVDTAVADALVAAVTGQAGNVAEYKQEAKKQNQPLAFALSGITALASSKFGYSAEDVLNTCQALYETHKLTSCPRTDCACLPESQHADAPQVLDAIKHVNPALAGIVDGADTGIKSRTW